MVICSKITAYTPGTGVYLGFSICWFVLLPGSFRVYIRVFEETGETEDIWFLK